MAEDEKNPNIVFVNLLREERTIDETSVIARSLRDMERWVAQRGVYELVNTGLSKLLNVEKLPQGNAAMHEQVEEFRSSLKPGECGVFAHGNSFSIMDNRQNTTPEHSKLTARGIENLLKASGCTPDMPVILYSCNTGAGANPLAAELSNFHPTVVAPDGVIAEFITASKPGIFKGDEQTGEIDENSPRKWKVFSHGKEIASYEWGSESIHTQQKQQSSPER